MTMTMITTIEQTNLPVDAQKRIDEYSDILHQYGRLGHADYEEYNIAVLLLRIEELEQIVKGIGETNGIQCR